MAGNAQVGASHNALPVTQIVAEFIATHQKVACRVGNATYPGHAHQGWHITGFTGTLGAPAVCAQLCPSWAQTKPPSRWALPLRTVPVGEGSSLAGHPATFVGACKADGGAFLAVVHFVLLAFLTASLAYLGTQRANCIGMFAAAGHGRRSEGTGLGAIDVQRDAPGHHLHIVLL